MAAFIPPTQLPNGQKLVDVAHAGARGAQPAWIYTCVENHARRTALVQSEIEAALASTER
jgi:hypothetical protein